MATARKTAAPRKAVAAKKAPAKRAAPAPSVAQPAKAPGKGAAKAKKPRLVRHSYALTRDEYDLLQSLKERAARAGHPAKKGELVRAGIALLARMPDAGLLTALAGVPSRKALQARK